MKRKMLFFERFMYVDGVTAINCVMTARVRGTVRPEDLHTALKKLQARHPLLRARVLEEDDGYSFVIDEKTPEIPIRMVERKGPDDWREVTRAEWQMPFDTQTGPMLRVVWVQSEERSEFILIAHHCICDGSSIMTLMREILLVADQPETQLVPLSLYTSLSELVPAEVMDDERAWQRVRKKATLYKIFLSVFGRKKTVLPAGDPYALYWCAKVEEFAAINARCNSEDTNPYAALCVAFLLAFREVQGKAAKNKIMCPVSIRRFVRSIKTDMMFAFAPTIELSLGEDRLADFWVQARRMKAKIAVKIEALNVYDELMMGDVMLPNVPRILNFLRSSRGGHDLAFSNVGRLKIPSKYQHFEVEAVMGATVVVPWRNTNTLIMTHFQNELDLNFISNERFLPELEATAIQQRALQLLREALQKKAAG